MKITLLATGFGIQDIHMKEMDDRITQRTAEEQQRLAELEEERGNRDATARSVLWQGCQCPFLSAAAVAISISSILNMDNADIISMVENSPTHLRDKSTLNSIKMKAEQEGQFATEAAQEAEGGAGESSPSDFSVRYVNILLLGEQSKPITIWIYLKSQRRH